MEMGFISQKIFPACGNMCVCCPALRSRSRQPVKRYRKLLADMFPKSPDGHPSDRKIVKLCEYASRNPVRIPKIAKYLEERCYKELRSGHVKLVNIVTEAFNKLLSMCKVQIAYFAVNVLNVISELLGSSKHDEIRTLGCQILTTFIYSQANATYTHNIEKLVRKVCILSQEHGESHAKCCLRAASLQCLSAMIWFMAEFSHIFDDFDEIVRATLDNYGRARHSEGADIRAEPHHNWVDEVVRCEGRGGAVISNENRPSCLFSLSQPEIKDPSHLNREEIENPETWAQICIQRMVELAKESTTMRCVLDPMFVYFDSGHHWDPQHGLAMMVLSTMAHFTDNSDNQLLILASVIRHLDHKNVMHDPRLKTSVIQVARGLAMQIRSGRGLVEVGFVGDLCRHLRKSLQASSESVGEQELNLNIMLQNSIEECLLEIAKAIVDVRPLFDLMAITLENLPPGITARATIRSLIILSRMIALALVCSHAYQAFPEVLLVQLLTVMLHSDVEARVGAHQIFSILVFPNSYHPHECSDQHKIRHAHTSTASASASVIALLEKLRRGSDGTKSENHGQAFHDDYKERDNVEDWKQGCSLKNSPKFYRLSSTIDKTTASTSLTETEPNVLKLGEDQIAQLLSSFWVQANLPDNLPSNIQAIAHSFMLTLTASHTKNLNDKDNNLVVRFFQLPLSLWNMSLEPSNGMLPPARQRSVLVLSTSMLMFAGKSYQIHELNDLFKSLAVSEIDPFLGISDDFQVYTKIHVDAREYGTAADNQLAMSTISELQNTICEYKQAMKDILVQNLANITKLDADSLAAHLEEAFRPDEEFMFGPKSIIDQNHKIMHSKESLSFDGDFLSNSVVEDDAISEASVSDVSRFFPKMPASPAVPPRLISIGQLMESALEVAGQVAGTAVSTSPLTYNAMASQCEALGTCARKRLSNWLAYENHYSHPVDKSLLAFSESGIAALEITNDGGHAQVAALPRDPWLAMKLPPASPFDNFLKAARC
ncbi:protein SEMI-ROLLED LEAF 2 isoform X2 [Prosopis cineraria]|uniref:protein SEMI-ROLLED LEAF 2 isoform X2 n=1 Tax=Prosopis cineraria TaxID=364024 RepID=UPI00240ED12B|nr:protein SEMI-ROLLED LEAF 2 isoform X2 [Prosopis cineraria]